jgi:hypothetical protein
MADVFYRDGTLVKVHDRVQGQDSNGSHAVNLVPLRGSIVSINKFSVIVALTEPQIYYYKSEGGKRLTKWNFVPVFNNETRRLEVDRMQGDPFEHGEVRCYLEKVDNAPITAPNGTRRKG